MPVSYIEPVDPAELASRFSTEDVLDPLPEGMDETYRREHLEKIKAVMDLLPDRETDLVDLYFFKGKKQTDIAEVFDITQAAVSYRLKRAMQRIRFLVELPDATKDDVYEDLLEWKVMDKLDAKIFAEMYETTCQSKVAERLDLTQGRVRHRFLSNLASMGEFLIDRFEEEVVDRFPEGTMEREDLTAELKSLRKRRAKDGFESEEEFENQVQQACEAVIASASDDLGELGRIYDYYRTFVTIRYNFNIRREIKLPRWSNRPDSVIS